MSDVTDVGTSREAPAKLFTVGIPVFNGKSLLRSCLTSVVGSTFPHERYEILIADDGSTEPETLEILREFERAHAAEPGFFRVITLPTNSGGAARPRNRILDEAIGEYVFFVDADDTVGSEALERIADALDSVPADWVALHQALVNGRVGAARVRQPKVEVPRSKAFSTLTVHKVFRRAEIERQRLRFDEGLPSGQDVSFAFSYILGASRFLMLGGYDYYYLTRHAGNPDEPPHLSRTANTAKRLIEKNHRILASMLADLRTSSLPLAERLDILGNVALPRVLVQQRYLSAIVSEGRAAGSKELRRLSQLLRDPLAAQLDPDLLVKGFTPEHLQLVRTADWSGLKELVKQPGPQRRSRLTTLTKVADRLVVRGRGLADVVSGRTRHRRVMRELAHLRQSLSELRDSQSRLQANLRGEAHPEDAGPGGAGEPGRPAPTD